MIRFSYDLYTLLFINVHTVVGVLNHGRCTMGFVDMGQFPHGSNLTLNVLIRTLARMPRIPRTVYLQFDNCYRENKNRLALHQSNVLINVTILA